MEENPRKKVKPNPAKDALIPYPIVQQANQLLNRALVDLNNVKLRENGYKSELKIVQSKLLAKEEELKQLRKMKWNVEKHALVHHPIMREFFKVSKYSVHVIKRVIVKEEGYKAEIKLLKNKLLAKEEEMRQIQNENWNLKKETSKFYKKPISVTPLPTSDSLVFPAIEQSDTVTSLLSLITDLLIYDAKMGKTFSQTIFEKMVSDVSTFAIKLLSGTKHQVSRALYLLAKSFDLGEAKNQLQSSYDSDSLDKHLKPSEYALICGFKNTMREIPSLAEILDIFCTKLELQLLADGQLSHCRVYAAVCQLLNRTYMPFCICKELLLRKEKLGLTFVAVIGVVYPDVLWSHFKPEEPMDIETKLFYNFILSKPSTMLQVAQCHHIFTSASKLPSSSPFNFQDIVQDLLKTLIEHCVSESSHDLSNLTSVRLIVLQMGNLWSISNILRPLFENLRNEEMSQIIKICSGPE